MPTGVIFFELNEVPDRVLDTFIDKHPQSSFARLSARARRFGTTAEDEAPLSPWITWPTVHRGVNDVKHRVLEFGQPLDEVDQEYPPIWKLLVKSGRRVGIGGSLHSHPMPVNLAGYDFYLPDPFAASERAHPALLERFQRFNLEMSRRSGRNVSSEIAARAASSFLLNAPRLGVEASTVGKVARQLFTEFAAPHRKNRRRTIQSVLSFDVFFRQLTRTHPDFATYFTNHVASAMHRYWAASFPADYDEFGYDSTWVERFSDEIDYAMQQADDMLARLLAFVERSGAYQLWVLSSMGQAPTIAEPVKTQLYVDSLDRFMRALDLPAAAYRRVPAMLPQYNFLIDTAYRARFQQRLSTFFIGGSAVGHRATDEHCSLYLGQQNLSDETPVTIGDRTLTLNQAGLRNVPIDDQTNTNAYHIKEGILLIYDPKLQHDRAATTLGTTQIAPSLLRHFGIEPPGYMAADAI